YKIIIKRSINWFFGKGLPTVSINTDYIFITMTN
ncbi:MAG: hypothetical protein ACI8SZ_002352, partial [Colwellia sp.]